MTERNVFEKLVTNMNSDERQKLLSKIQDIKDLPSEPLKKEDEETGVIDFKREYSQLNFFQKVFIMIKKLFTGKSPVKLVEDLIIKRYTEKIQHQATGLVNFTAKCFLTGMCNELNSLNNSLKKIRAPFALALESKRKDFFAFYVGLEMDALQERLIQELDPYTIYEDNKLVEATDVKEEMQKRLQNILLDISDGDRSKMNHNAFSLHYLYKLCFFEFDELVGRFNDSGYGGIGSLGFPVGLKDFSRLLDLLQSSSYPPPLSAVESVILFGTHGAEPSESEEGEGKSDIEASVQQVEEVFNGIRRFNKKVPLLGIMKAATRNLNYAPKLVKGGDDWFILFKGYWEDKINESYKIFFGDIKKKTFIINIKEYLKTDDFPFVVHYSNQSQSQTFSFKYPLSMGLICGFHEKIFLKALNKPLNILLLQGTFYKQENRTEFTDSYNQLNELKKHLDAFEAKLAPGGDLGYRIERTQNEIMKGNLKVQHMEAVLKDVDKEALEIIKLVITAVKSVELILNGVLYSKSGSKYDSISNIKHIGGKSNADLITSWKISLNLVHKMYEFLSEVSSLEAKGSL